MNKLSTSSDIHPYQDPNQITRNNKTETENVETSPPTPPPSPTIGKTTVAVRGKIDQLAEGAGNLVLKGASKARAGFKAAKTLPGQAAHAAANGAKAAWKFAMTTDKYFDFSKTNDKTFKEIISNLQKVTDLSLLQGRSDGKVVLLYQGKKLDFQDLKKLAQEQATHHKQEAEKLRAQADVVKLQVGEDHDDYKKLQQDVASAEEKAGIADYVLINLADAEIKHADKAKRSMKPETEGVYGEHVAKGKLAGHTILSMLSKATLLLPAAHWLLTSKRTFKLPGDESNGDGSRYLGLCKQLQAAFPDSHIEVSVHEGEVLVKVDGKEKGLAELQEMAKKEAHRAETLPKAQVDAMKWVRDLDLKELKGELSIKLRIYRLAQQCFKEPRIVVDLNRDTDTPWWQNTDTAKRSLERAKDIKQLSGQLFGTNVETSGKGSAVTVGLKAEAGGKAEKLSLQELRERTNQKILDLKHHLEFANLDSTEKGLLKDRIKAGEQLLQYIAKDTPAQRAEVRAHRNILQRAVYNMTYAMYLPTIVGMGALKGMRTGWRERKYSKEIDRQCEIALANLPQGTQITSDLKKKVRTKVRNAMKVGFKLQEQLEKQGGKHHEVGKMEGQYKAFIAEREKIINGGGSPHEIKIAEQEIAAFKEALKFENRALRNAMFHGHPDTIKFLINEELFRNVAPGDVLFNSDTPALLFALEHRVFDKSSPKIKEEIKAALFRNCADAASREVIIQNLYNNGQADLAEKLVLELFRENVPNLSKPPTKEEIQNLTDKQISAYQLAMTLGTPALLKEVFDINPGDSQGVIQKKVAPFLLMPDIAGRTLLDFAPVGQNMNVRLALRQALIEKYNSRINPPDPTTYKEARAAALQKAIDAHQMTSTKAGRKAALDELIKEFPELAYLRNIEVSMQSMVFGGLAKESQRSRKMMLGHLQRELSNLQGDPLEARDVTGRRPLRSITRDMAIDGNALLTQDRVNLQLATQLKNKNSETDARALSLLNTLAQSELKGEQLNLFKERFQAIVNKHTQANEGAKQETQLGLLRADVTVEEYRSLLELLPQKEVAATIEMITDGNPIDLAKLKKDNAVNDFTMAGAYYHVLESPRVGFITSCVIVGKYTGCLMAVGGLSLLSPSAGFFTVQFIFQGSICSNIAAGAYIGGTQNRAFWGKLMASVQGYNRDMPNLKALRPVNGSPGKLEVERPPGLFVRGLKAMGYEDSGDRLDAISKKLGDKLDAAKALVAKYVKKAQLEGGKLVSIDENSAEIVHHIAHNDADAAIEFINGLSPEDAKHVNWDHVIGNLHKMVHYESQEQRMALVDAIFNKLQTPEQLDDLIEIQNNMCLKPTFVEKFLDQKIADLKNISFLPAPGSPERKQLDMQYAALLLAAAKIGSHERYRQLKALKPLFASCDLVKVGGGLNSLLHASLLSKLNSTNNESVALAKEVFRDMTAYAQVHYPSLDVLQLRRGGSAWYTRWHAAVRVQDKITLEKAELFDEAVGAEPALSGSLSSVVMRRLVKHTLSLASEFIMVLPCKLMLNVAAGSKAEVAAEVFAHHASLLLPFVPKVILEAFAIFVLETGVLVSGFAAGIVLGKGITGSLQHARAQLDEYTQLSAYGNTPTERMEKARLQSRVEEQAAARMSIGLLQDSIQEVINSKTAEDPDVEKLQRVNAKLEELKNSNKEGKNMILEIKYVFISEQIGSEGPPMVSFPALANVHENLLANLEDPVKFGEKMQEARGAACAAAGVGPLDPTTNPHVRLAENFVKLKDTLVAIYACPFPKGTGSVFEEGVNALKLLPGESSKNSKLKGMMSQGTFESPYELGNSAQEASKIVDDTLTLLWQMKMIDTKSVEYIALRELAKQLRDTKDAIIKDARASHKEKKQEA